MGEKGSTAHRSHQGHERARRALPPLTHPAWGSCLSDTRNTRVDYNTLLEKQVKADVQLIFAIEVCDGVLCHSDHGYLLHPIVP